MDFFERQEKARRNTKLLVIYFIAGVGTLIISIYVVVMLIFAGVNRGNRYRTFDAEVGPQQSLWNPRIFLGIAAGTLAVIGCGSAFKTLELAQGGRTVGSMLGGRPVSPDTSDPAERRLLNVVEEMAIAAGVPVPQVYLLPEERGINAFAAGHSASDAVIEVTAGAVNLLSRDELQGVIGHEFSHLLNGDMRLNLRLMGVIFGLVCLAVIGRVLLYTRRDSRDRNPLPVLGLALVVLGWIGVFFGRLIQAAVSRQREFLADASSVQFTRNPAGLAGALKKIGGLSYGSRLESPHASEASHMFFGNGMSESFLNLMETHPPLGERIRAIDPSFDGRFPQIESAEEEPLVSATRRAQPQPSLFPFPSSGRSPATLAGLTGLGGLAVPPTIPARSVMPNLGNPTPAHLRYAEELRTSIPESVRAAARQPLGASTLIYALLLSREEAARAKQLDELTRATSPEICQETLRLLPQIEGIALHVKLPLVDLALPALRNFSPVQFEQFRTAVKALVESDNEIDLFEYVLQKIVLRHLEPHFSGGRKPVIQYYAIKPLVTDCAVVLSALAFVGSDDPAKAEAAFQQGAQPLSYAAQVQLTLVPAAQCDLSAVEAALDRLAQAVPQIKKNVLNACVQVVAADGVIQEMEAELLRGIADSLDCPMPPFLATQ